MDPAKTSLRVARSTIVMRADEVSEMVLDERDKYGNQCNVADDVSLSKYRFDVKQVCKFATFVLIVLGAEIGVS